jgi:DNA-binding CsgD family transcriptional regulator
MNDFKLPLELIGCIYDATLDPSLWIDALGKTARFVGGSSAVLFSKDVRSRAATMAFEYNIDAERRRLYCDRYDMLDPTTTGHVLAEIGEPVAAADIMPHEELAETPVDPESVRPQGVVDFVAAVLDKSATSTVIFGVFHHQRDGVVESKTRSRVQLIAPHIRRAVHVARLVDLRKAEADTLAETLDGLSAGMFLIGTDGQVVHANAAGHAILGAGEVLNAVGGQLVASDVQAGQTLRRALAAAAHRDVALGRNGITVPLTARNGERHVAHVLPLTAGARRRAGMSSTASAALFVRKAALEASPAPEVISKTYNLTPTELRVLLTVVEVGAIADVAAALGVAESTVKTHLRSLFEKTGAGRQADLVKLVAGFSSPLAGSFSQARA